MSTTDDDLAFRVRLGITYYMNAGWTIVIQSPYIGRLEIQKIQGVIRDHLHREGLTGAENPYAESSSPYTHEVLVYHLDNQPHSILAFLHTLYPLILAQGFRNPDM